MTTVSSRISAKGLMSGHPAHLLVSSAPRVALLHSCCTHCTRFRISGHRVPPGGQAGSGAPDPSAGNELGPTGCAGCWGRGWGRGQEGSLERRVESGEEGERDEVRRAWIGWRGEEEEQGAGEEEPKRTAWG